MFERTFRFLAKNTEYDSQCHLMWVQVDPVSHNEEYKSKYQKDEVQLRENCTIILLTDIILLIMLFQNEQIKTK